jgi:hypothetical protein
MPKQDNSANKNGYGSPNRPAHPVTVVPSTPAKVKPNPRPKAKGP